MRLRDLEEEIGDRLRLEWRAFLLRPEPPSEPRALEDFQRYTESWRRPQAMEPRAGLRVWSSDEGPPSHSLPPHQAAKAAARIDAGAGERLHELLLDAYFRQSRDITSDRVLQDLWTRAGLAPSRFGERDDPTVLAEIETDFREALAHGAAGAPAARMEGSFGVVTGAQPTAVYRRWVEKTLAA